MTRRSPDRSDAPDWMLTQRITIEEVLRALTIDAAYANGQESSSGSLVVGKAADVVILSHDPIAVVGRQIEDIEV